MFHSSNISVIIPTYNRAALLVGAVESVARQTAPVGEIIVVDDGSTDETPATLSELASRISNLKVVTIEHTKLLGPIRNAGIAASSGSILAFLDSDDLWKPTRVESQLAAWDAVLDAAIAFCNLHCFNEHGLAPSGPYLANGMDYSGNILSELLREPVVVPSAMMFTREAFDRLGPFSRRIINEDYELLLEIAAHYTASYVPEPLVLLREHEGMRASSRMELSNLEYLSMVRNFLARHGEISASDKAHARQGLANVHLKMARHYIEAGNRRAARKHVAAMARLRPWDRRLPGAFAMLAVIKDKSPAGRP